MRWKRKYRSLVNLHYAVVVCFGCAILFLLLYTFNFRWIFLALRNAADVNSRSAEEHHLVFGSENYRTLLDVREGLGSEEPSDTCKHEQKNILWYNKPKFINLTFFNSALKTHCAFRNCYISTDKRKFQNYSAIIFSLSDPLDFFPPIHPDDRDPDQAWVFYNIEPPVHEGYSSHWFYNWRNTMNWSMSYTTNSDIFYPYGTLASSGAMTEQNYGVIYRRKTQDAAWIVSHCGASSGRDEYVAEMVQAGFDVQIFGKCGDSIYRDQDRMIELVNRDFKFLFSFENSFCRDYISEKFFTYFNLEVILVVRGGADYDRLLPKHTFINAADFESAGALADYLNKVALSEKLYTEFLRRKSQFTSTDLFSMPTPYCSLCQKLNNLRKNRKSYSDHIGFIHRNACWTPSDVQTTFWGKHIVKILVLCSLAIGFAVCYMCRIRRHAVRDGPWFSLLF